MAVVLVVLVVVMCLTCFFLHAAIIAVVIVLVIVVRIDAICHQLQDGYLGAVSSSWMPHSARLGADTMLLTLLLALVWERVACRGAGSYLMARGPTNLGSQGLKVTG